jgi:hypothetical protein
MDDTGLSQTATNVAVGALVLTLTQSTKRFTPEGWGPLIAAIWTTLALGVWLTSQADWPPARTASFEILSVWVSVYATALGLYSAAMVPSGSAQSIGTGNGRKGDGNVPVGETEPEKPQERPKRARGTRTRKPPENGSQGHQ